MLVRFTSPELASLDELDAEVLAAGVYENSDCSAQEGSLRAMK